MKKSRTRAEVLGGDVDAEATAVADTARRRTKRGGDGYRSSREAERLMGWRSKKRRRKRRRRKRRKSPPRPIVLVDWEKKLASIFVRADDGYKTKQKGLL